MPIYEYKCSACGRVTSDLRLMAQREEPLQCRHCGGRAEVILSQFSSVKRESGADAWSPPCDDCGST